MLYEELMFDTSLLLRFSIFKYLNQSTKKVLAISQLSEDLDLNYQQSVIELNEIDQELAEIRPNYETIMMRAGKVNLENLNASIDEYRYHLLKQAVPFQFILYFLNEEEPTIEQFCEKYFVSRSTVSRKIDKLKKHLKRFNIRFTYTEAGMSGDERLIRLALFDLLWLGTRGIECPVNVEPHQLSRLVDSYKDYFPLSRTYFGTQELRLFAAIDLTRIKNKKFVKYDPRYNFLMKDNSYYDFTSLRELIDVPMTTRQLKGEASFIYFLAHFAPFYTIREDQSLKQTLLDFDARQNPVNDFVMEFRNFAKKALFPDRTEIMDDPLVIGNLLNITFGYFIFRQPFPNIIDLVMDPNEKQTRGEYILFQNIQNFIQMAKDNPSYSFISSVHPLITRAFKRLLLPYFNQFPYTHNLKIGIALEHNAIFVRELYRFLEDLRFIDAEPYDISLKDDYDLIISTSSLLKKEKPNIPLYQLDFPYTKSELISLYLDLRSIYDKKNRVYE
ncbi:helix-turn-helix domain-containing protein [Enterococcus xiangfangensis]|uniref:Helix-turn-helix domain-containing protein n=1 Tax=Enterococcus xiangfangensis TaxID=1296537 RepID=A0ABU3FBH4_9ENTE|nr:helix-turn-helix domain-containing protein [Enterococcus xiangfangensis]MDT2760020.1 helix-turn-helix domain-containing protein [Enterococcus xiangfangensis]